MTRHRRTVTATPNRRHVSKPQALRSVTCVWSAALLLSCFLLLSGCTGETSATRERPGDEPGSATQNPPFGHTSADTLTPVVTSSETATPQPRWPVTIAAVGDIMLARGVSAAISPERPDGPFAHVRDILQSADLTVGNLECTISDLGEAGAKSYTFRAPPLAASGLATAGFDLVSLANNHSLDFGPDALLDTIETLRVSSVEAVGGGRNDEEAYRYRVLTTNGVRVAFLGLAEVPSDGEYDMRVWTAAAEKPGIAWVDEDRLATTVREAAEVADLVVVMFHFGVEGSPEPSARQRQIARSAIDAGANLVLGSHPHVVQEIEKYNDGLIAYSLGNFVFDGFEGVSNESGILLGTFAVDRSISWRIEPVSIGWDGLPRPSD